MEDIVFDILNENPPLAGIINNLILEPFFSIGIIHPCKILIVPFRSTQKIFTEEYMKALDVYRLRVFLWCVRHSKGGQLSESLREKLEKEPLYDSIFERPLDRRTTFDNILNKSKGVFRERHECIRYSPFSNRTLEFQDYRLIVAFLAYIDYETTIASFNHKFKLLYPDYKSEIYDIEYWRSQVITMEIPDLIETFIC